MNSKSITLIAVSDNHYAILLASMLKSVELNHKTEEKIICYVVEDDMSNYNKEKVIASINPQVITIYWISIKEVLKHDIKLPLDASTYPLNIYAKLFIPYFIDQEIEKAVFLDVDMIVQEDISKLWNVDLGENIIAAVQDHYIEFVDSWDGIKNYRTLGLSPKEKYFNAGLLIIDTKKWRSLKIENEIINCISNNIMYANFPEQYGLNVVLYKKWLELDPLWNFFASYEHENPYIIHFIGRKPIYNSYINSKLFKEIFYRYLGYTAWHDFKPRSNMSVFVRKIRNKLRKINLEKLNFYSKIGY